MSQRSFPDLIHHEGSVTIYYPDSDAAWSDWLRNYGPFRITYTDLEPSEQEVVRRAALNILDWHRTQDGTVTMRLPYLQSVATKAGGGRLG